MKNMLLILTIITTSAASAIEPGTPAYRDGRAHPNGLPERVSWRPNQPHYDRATWLHDADGVLALVPWTNVTPDGMEITNHTYVIADGVATEVVEYGPIVVAVPESVTPRQIRLALLAIGVTPAMIEAQLSQIEDPVQREASLIEWLYANSVKRAHPMIEAMGQALGLDSAGIDALFIQAVGYE